MNMTFTIYGVQNLERSIKSNFGSIFRTGDVIL